MSDRSLEGFRLSPQQRRIWLHGPDRPAFRSWLAVRVDGPREATELDRAVAGIAGRHEILRTRFPRLEWMSMPLQVIDGEPPATEEVAATGGDPLAALAAILERFESTEDLPDRAPVRFYRSRLGERSHLLVVALSSLCADGRSLDNLFRELCHALGGGNGAPSGPAPVQYVRFAEWHNRLLDDGAPDERKEAWRRLDLDALAGQTLGFERRAAAGELAIEGVSRELSPATSHALRRLADELAVAPARLVLAAYRTVLGRLAGGRDVVVGRAFDARRIEPLEGALGPFALYLPLETRYDPAFTLGELASLYEAAVDDATGRQEYLSWSGDGGRGEERFLPYVFDADAWPVPARAGRTDLSVVGRRWCIDRFKLRLTHRSGAGPDRLELEHDPRHLSARVAGEIGDRLLLLLDDFVARPRTPVGDLEIVGAAERRRLLAVAEGVAEPVPDATLDALLTESIGRYPDRVALVDGGRALSFRQLGDRVGRMAARLGRLGVGPEVRVALCAERSIDQVVALWAVLRAGGAYVPLDPSLPDRRLAFMLDDALAGQAARVVLTQEALAPRLRAGGRTVVTVDGADGEGVDGAQEAPARRAVPGNAAYLIYTSGTTGRPKAALVEHRSVVGLEVALRRVVPIDPEVGARVSLNAPLAFDSSVKQVVQLLRGATLHVIPDAVRPDGERLLERVERERIDVLDCTPSQLTLLRRAGLAAEPVDAGAPSPRVVLLGGEAVPEDDWAAMAADPGRAYVNLYGPTECTVDATAARVDPGSRRPVIGGPLANLRVHVVDARLHPVPAGVEGELLIAGGGVARGYPGDRRLTAGRFVPEPGGTDEVGSRAYRTGDRVRRLAGGELEFLGRVDRQVKVRGVRIEPAEVEVQLAEHPDVSRAVVVAEAEEGGGYRLVAWAVPVAGRELDPEALRDHLRVRLPAAAVPAAVVPVPEIPLTANGKLDRAALPIPEEALAGRARRPPRTPTEEVVANLWHELLEAGEVSADDDFFLLGGHSLLATRLLARVRRGFQLDVPLRLVFEAPVLERFAAELDRLRRSDEGAIEEPPLAPVPRTGPLPLSPPQRRLWFLAQLAPESPFYNAPAVVRMDGRLELAALAAAFSGVAARHEILRTAFPAVDGRPVAVAGEPRPVALPVIDLGGLPEDRREVEARALVDRLLGRPFDLAVGRLLRSTALRFGARSHVLVLALHHMVTDAWSVSVLVRELCALYRARVEGGVAELPELPLQYADFAHWLDRRFQGEALDRQLGFWRGCLASPPPPLELPADRPRPAVPSLRGGRTTSVLDPEVARRAARFGSERGSTLFMTLLTAFVALLHRYSDQDDMVLGTAAAGRDRVETEGLIGPFLNMLPLRADVSGGPTFQELLGRIRTAVLGAYDHQDVPFEKLVEELQPDRGAGHAPLFQVAFGLDNAPAGDAVLPGVEVTSLEHDTGVARYDLTVWVRPREDGDGALDVAWRYSRDRFERPTLERMARHYESLLHQVLERPDARLAELEPWTEEEREAMSSRRRERRSSNLDRLKSARRRAVGVAEAEGG